MQDRNRVAVVLGHRMFLPTVLIFALLLRLAIILVPVAPTMDFEWYMARAIEIVKGQGYSIRSVRTAYWPVGWPGVLAGLFSITGVSIAAAQIVNALLGTLCCWLTALLGQRLTGSRAVGGLAALLIAIYPNQIGYVPLLATEIFYQALLLMLVLMLVTARRPPVMWLLTGALFGVATLTKTQTFVLPAILLGWMWLVRPDRATFRDFLLRGSLIYLGLVCTVAPWSYRNWTVFHEFVPVSTNGGWTLLTGNNPEADGGYLGETSLARDIGKDFEPTREVERDRIFNQRAVTWIKQNPVRLLALLPKKLFKMWAGDGEAEWGYQRGFVQYDRYIITFRSVRVINQIFYVMIMLAAFPACWWLLRGRTGLVTRWAHTGIALFTYLSILTLVFSGQSRFHFNLMPFMAIYAAWTPMLWSTRHKQAINAASDNAFNGTTSTENLKCIPVKSKLFSGLQTIHLNGTR